MTTCTCSILNLRNRAQIAHSNEITVSKCACGCYWLLSADYSHQATGDEVLLCKLLESLAKSIRVRSGEFGR